jgi:hypothetical protein
MIKTIGDPEEKKLETLMALISSLMQKKYYGEVVIKFQAGKIVLIEKKETLKL